MASDPIESPPTAKLTGIAGVCFGVSGVRKKKK